MEKRHENEKKNKKYLKAMVKKRGLAKFIPKNKKKSSAKKFVE